MSSRYYQFQNDSSPSTQVAQRPSNRKSTSSDSSSSSSSSASSSHYAYDSAATRSPSDASRPRVEIMRCSRCTKSVETIVAARGGTELRRISTDDASASGMVRFGHNLYYCERCAKMVGYT